MCHLVGYGYTLSASNTCMRSAHTVRCAIKSKKCLPPGNPSLHALGPGGPERKGRDPVGTKTKAEADVAPGDTSVVSEVAEPVKTTLQTRVSPDVARKFAAVAKARNMTDSQLLRYAIKLMLREATADLDRLQAELLRDILSAKEELAKPETSDDA